MTLIPPHVVDHLRNESRSDHDVKQQLRALDKEHRETLTALNQAEASVAHSRKLNDLSYHRRRKAILANGHDDNAE